MLELCKWGSNECELLENVDCFEYLGTQVSADGGCKRDVLNRMNEGLNEGLKQNEWGSEWIASIQRTIDLSTRGEQYRDLRVQGRPGLSWMDGVTVFLGSRGMTVEAADHARNIGRSGEL